MDVPKSCVLIFGPDLHPGPRRRYFNAFWHAWGRQLWNHLPRLYAGFQFSPWQTLMRVNSEWNMTAQSLLLRRNCVSKTSARLLSDDPEWDQKRRRSLTCKSSWGRLSFSNICFGGVTADGWYPKKDKTYPSNLCRLNLALLRKKGWWKTAIKTTSSGHCLNTRSQQSLARTHTQTKLRFFVSSVVSFDVNTSVS